jgi:hypothetical protein
MRFLSLQTSGSLVPNRLIVANSIATICFGCIISMSFSLQARWCEMVVHPGQRCNADDRAFNRQQGNLSMNLSKSFSPIGQPLQYPGGPVPPSPTLSDVMNALSQVKQNQAQILKGLNALNSNLAAVNFNVTRVGTDVLKYCCEAISGTPQNGVNGFGGTPQNSLNTFGSAMQVDISTTYSATMAGWAKV